MCVQESKQEPNKEQPQTADGQPFDSDKEFEWLWAEYDDDVGGQSLASGQTWPAHTRSCLSEQKW